VRQQASKRAKAKKDAGARKAPKVKAKKTLKKAAAKATRKPARAAPRRSRAKTAEPLKKSPLSKSQLREFKELLLTKRRDLLGDMNGIEAEAFGKDGSGDLSNMPTHPADIGTDNYEHEFTLGLLESERTLLKEIDEALDRVQKGMFGICLGTGQAINTARLKARPWAKYSIEYARQLEKGLVPPAETEPGAEEDEGKEPGPKKDVLGDEEG